jgi:tetratricopeptide (TPR) repeat protein
MQPLQIKIGLADFDYSLIDMKNIDGVPEKISEAIIDFFTSELKDAGGDIQVAVTEDEIVFNWTPVSKQEPTKLISYAISLLQKGAYKKAEPILSSLIARFPESCDLNHNYGMLLSDKNELEQAIKLLNKATELQPKVADSWTALGVAYQRKGNLDAAQNALMKSYDIDSNNPYTLRNLGAILAKTNPKEGIKFLEAAVKILPDDQQAQYGYGLCLFTLKHYAQADPVLIKAIEISPFTQIAELCRQMRTEISHINLKQGTPSGVRPDVIMFCLAALQRFKQVGTKIRQQIVFEIAMLGRNGLDINDPTPKYDLKSMEGKFSGLQLVAYMYVGFKQIDPTMDAGIDFSKEYQEAKKMFDKGN